MITLDEFERHLTMFRGELREYVVRLDKARQELKDLSEPEQVRMKQMQIKLLQRDIELEQKVIRVTEKSMEILHGVAPEQVRRLHTTTASPFITIGEWMTDKWNRVMTKMWRSPREDGYVPLL